MRYITQVERVFLNGHAGRTLPHDTYKQYVEWLSHWTCRNNIKAVLSDTKAEGIEKCRELVKLVIKSSLYRGADNSHFNFQVTRIAINDDGTLWLESHDTDYNEYKVEE